MNSRAALTLPSLAERDGRTLEAMQARMEPSAAPFLAWLRRKEARALGSTPSWSYRIAAPRTVNEKFLWRKLFDRDPRFVTISDKLGCKAWVARSGVGVEVPRVLWVGRDAAEIPPELLARDVVIKANHGTATNLFLRGGTMPRDEVVERANAFLAIDHGSKTGEWAYGPIDRRLFVEELVHEGRPLIEMNIFTYGRRVERIVYLSDRFGDRKVANWDMGPDGRLRLSEGRASLRSPLLEAPLPPSHHRALEIASAIGAGFDHLRVDFMSDGQRLWLGELTLWNLAGFVLDCGHLEDCAMTRAWDLRRSWFLRRPQAEPALRDYAAALRREIARHGP